MSILNTSTIAGQCSALHAPVYQNNFSSYYHVGICFLVTTKGVETRNYSHVLGIVSLFRVTGQPGPDSSAPCPVVTENASHSNLVVGRSEPHTPQLQPLHPTDGGCWTRLSPVRHNLPTLFAPYFPIIRCTDFVPLLFTPVRLGSQYVTLPRRTALRVCVASISIYVARCDTAQRATGQCKVL